MKDNFGLHRNIHPNHLSDGKVTMEAFSASSAEDYELSVDCEKIWSGRTSYEHRTVTLEKKSVGVWTIPREEVSKLKCPIKADREDNNPSHSLIVYPKKDRAKRRDTARRLAAFANEGAVSRIP
ncbi:MAG: hypothetical protein AAF801_01615 [Pseudomonadota bacterium]